jgi:molybdopterin converting factor small subunit
MSTVQIPPVLRKHAGGARTVTAHGATLAEVLADMYSRYPDLRANLQGDDGSLSRFVNVYVDDQDVRLLGGLAATVKEDGEVIILPAMAGGQRGVTSG